MKIKSEQFRKYARLLNNAYVRGNRVTESFYLDLKNSCIYFKTDNYLGHMPFGLEKEDGENIKNLFVDIPVFMALCNEYDEITLQEKTVKGINEESKEYDTQIEVIFSNDTEEFQIPFFRETSESEDFDIEKFNYKSKENWEQFSLSEEFMNEIKLSAFYIGPDDFMGRNLSGVSIHPDSIVSTDGSKIFESMIESSFKTAIPNYATKLISLGVAMNLPVNFCKSKNLENLMIVYGHGEYSLILPEITDLYSPDLKDPKFMKAFKHDTSIVIDREEFLGVLQFFEPLVRDVKNQMLMLSIKNQKTLSIETKEDTIGNRNVDLVECSSELVNSGELWFARQDLVLGLTSILDEQIRIEINFSEEAQAFYMEGVTNKNRHIIVVKLKTE